MSTPRANSLVSVVVTMMEKAAHLEITINGAPCRRGADEVKETNPDDAVGETHVVPAAWATS
jgi:hypothetical protein